MYRKTIASIEQSAHEQLPERDCRCMRGTEKSVHTFSKTFKSSFLIETQTIRISILLNGNDLETSELHLFAIFCINIKRTPYCFTKIVFFYLSAIFSYHNFNS